MLSQYIGDKGLFEFVFNGLKKGTHIDVGAMRDILKGTHELRKLSLRYVKGKGLITMIGDLIRSQPPRLTELDFSGLGGSSKQGDYLLVAIYETGMQV